jgi:hypothetical protein
MMKGDGCTFPTVVFYPARNGWIAETQKRSTVVCAGGASYDGPSNGRFIIMRWDDTTGAQETAKVDVPGSGPVKITQAPLGRRVAGSAQRHGNLAFEGTKNVTGTLHLKDDSVTLSR